MALALGWVQRVGLGVDGWVMGEGDSFEILLFLFFLY